MRLLIIILSFLYLNTSFSQYDGNNNSWITNHIAYNNPAATGNKNTLVTNLSFRNDWFLTDNSPKTLVFSAQSPLRNRKWSLGAILINDRVSNFTNNSMLISSAYKIKTSNGDLCFGIKSGINIYSNNVDFNLHDADDIQYQEVNKLSTIAFGFGAYYHTKKYYFGLSIPEMANKQSLYTFNIANKNYWHKRLMAGRTFKINEKVESVNHLVVRQLGKGKPQLMLLSIVKFSDTYEIGISSRSNNTFGGLLSYQLNKQLKFSYIFDNTFEKAYPKSLGNHEFLISYIFGKIVLTENSKFF